MGAFLGWLDEQLKSPFGQLLPLAAGLLLRLAYGYHKKRPKKHRKRHKPSAQKA